MKNLINKIMNKSNIYTFSRIAIWLIALSYVALFIGCGYDVGDIKFYSPGIMNLTYLIWRILPFVLLAVYISKYHDRYKATIIIPIVFGIITLGYIFDGVDRFSIFIEYGNLYTGIQVIKYLILSVLFVLSTISSLQGFIEKRLVIITLSISLLLQGWSFINTAKDICLIYGGFNRYLILIGELSAIFANCLLYVSLLVFCLKCKIPVLLSPIINKITKSVSPDQKLRELKHKLDLGLISSEEYQHQREDIISKL